MATVRSRPDDPFPDPGTGRIDRAMHGLYAIEDLGGNCAIVYNGCSNSEYGVDLEEHHCTCHDSSTNGAYCKHLLRAVFERGVDPLTLDSIQ